MCKKKNQTVIQLTKLPLHIKSKKDLMKDETI